MAPVDRGRPLDDAALRELRHQARLGWAAFPIVGPGAVFYMRVLRGHRIAGLREARRTYRRALATGRPTLVCANHLTMVDSVYLHHGLASLADYLLDFRRFAWNLPAIENFGQSAFLRTLTHLTKCIPIDREGSPAHHERVREQVRSLVASGQVCTIFPEGGRSRTGRVVPAEITYGIGRILLELERPQVVCAYLRGERQRTWGSVPVWGDRLHLMTEILEPATTHSGLRGARDLSRQVAAKLAEMEARFLSGAARF